VELKHVRPRGRGCEGGGLRHLVTGVNVTVRSLLGKRL
jgi:hypothetical protein